MENFEKIEVNYSLRDILLANKREYTIKLYNAASKFINRLRWKVFFISRETTSFNEQKEENIQHQTPACDELKNFKLNYLSYQETLIYKLQIKILRNPKKRRKKYSDKKQSNTIGRQNPKFNKKACD